MDDARREALVAAELAAIVRGHAADFTGTPADFAGGAALVGEHGDAWILITHEPARAGLGPALIWADRRGVIDLDLICDNGDPDDARIVARRAGCFAPTSRVWSVGGGTIVPRAAAAPAVRRVAPSAPDLAELLVDAGLEVLVEDGIVRGEVLGLEVARIVHGTTTAGMPIDEPVLEVGVGHADREMTAMLHGNLPPTEQLARVVEIVLAQRRIGAERHPLNQMAPERWLRSRLVAVPDRIGLTALRPVEGALPRPNLRDRAVAHGLGTRPDGSEVLVACSVGIDPDLVPDAADARLAHAPEADLLVVVPERDAHPVTRALAALLARPAAVLALEGDWRA